MSIRNSKLHNTIVTEIDSFSKRGYGNTPLNTENENIPVYKIGFDYLTFTFPFNGHSQDDDAKLSSILKLLKLEPEHSNKLDHGFYGYRKCVEWPCEIKSLKESSTKFLYDAELNNSKRIDKDNPQINKITPTACFELTGDACRDFERRAGELMPDYWFKTFDELFFKYEAKFSRFDLCIDLFNSPISILDILRAHNEQRISTPLHKFTQNIVESKFGEYDEISLYIGSLGADVCINIYDKKLERSQVGYDVNFNSWYRIEFRFRHDKATNIILNLLKVHHEQGSIGEFVSSLLLRYLDIKDIPLSGKEYSCNERISKDTIRKWETNNTWLEVLGGPQKANVINFYLHESKIVKIANWEKRSVSKANLKLYLSDPASYKAMINEMLLLGYEKKLSNSDIKVINEYRKEKGYSQLSRLDLDKEVENIQMEYVDQLINLGNVDNFTGEVIYKSILPSDIYK